MFFISSSSGLAFEVALKKEDIPPDKVSQFQCFVNNQNTIRKLKAVEIGNYSWNERTIHRFYLLSNIDFERGSSCRDICLYYIVFDNGKSFKRKKYQFSFPGVMDFDLYKEGNSIVFVFLTQNNKIHVYKAPLYYFSESGNSSSEKTFLSKIFEFNIPEADQFYVVVDSLSGKPYLFLDTRDGIRVYVINQNEITPVLFDKYTEDESVGSFYVFNGNIFYLKRVSSGKTQLKTGKCSFHMNGFVSQILPIKFERDKVYFLTLLGREYILFENTSYDSAFLKYNLSPEFILTINYCPKLQFLRKSLFLPGKKSQGEKFQDSVSLIVVDFEKCTLNKDDFSFSLKGSINLFPGVNIISADKTGDFLILDKVLRQSDMNIIILEFVKKSWQ